MNKSARLRYEDLQKESEELDKIEKENHEKRFGLSNKINGLVAGVILEEKLLSKGDWKIDSYWNHNDTFALNCKQKSYELKELADLAETNYHCLHNLEAGVQLSFDDGRISLRLKSSLINVFLKKHQIIVDASEIDKLIIEKQNSLSSLLEIKKAFSP